jgi:hypothetical protein
VPTFVPFHAKPRYKTASSKVGWLVMENGCHIWQGCKDGCGYGVVRFEGKTRRVHRVRYTLEVGEIPEGMELDHFACDTPACCNPEHVRPASHYENVLRGRSFAAENAAKTHCPKGHPYTPENAIPWFAARGRKSCRACNVVASAAYYAANREIVNGRRRAERLARRRV